LSSASIEKGDELLNRVLFETLLEAKILTERWRKGYNYVRTYSSLGYRPPTPQTVMMTCQVLLTKLQSGPKIGVEVRPDEVAKYLIFIERRGYFPALSRFSAREVRVHILRIFTGVFLISRTRSEILRTLSSTICKKGGNLLKNPLFLMDSTGEDVLFMTVIFQR
jgi:hypothetical protein